MKNFTNSFKQFTSRLSARWLIMALMMLVGTSSAWGWSYKTAKESWTCRGNTGWSSKTIYTTPTGSSTKTGVDVVMMENPGSGFNIIQNDGCSGQQLYIGLTGTASSSTSTIVRATAYWNNGLYSTYTVVIPEGKIYIKPTNGSAVEMTKSRTYSNSSNTTKLLSACTYTASITLSSAKTFDLYATDPGATISNESSMPAAGKPSTVRLNYTGLTSPYQYVTVTYNLITNQITFTEDTPPCTPSATITEATYSCYGTTIHLEGSLTEACDGMFYGWQYKTTSGDDWSTATAIAGHATNNYSESATTYELDWTIPNPGTTYYFRAYATPDANTWYSDGTTEPVKTYKSPTLYTVSGSDATLTLSDSESGYTYTLYNNDNLVSNSATEGTGNALSWPLNDSGTYTVKAKPAESNCDEVLMSGSYTYNPYTYPAVSTISATINGDNLVCEGKITNMGSATTVVWAFTVLSNNNISKATTDWKYPDGQNQITAANTSFTYNIPISSLSLTEGNTYHVRAMAVDLDNLGLSNNQYGNAVAGDAISFVYEQVAGVKIAALGSTALYTNDPTHFIPMYVSNEYLAGVDANSVTNYTWQYSEDGTSGWTDCTRIYSNFNAANNQSNGNVVVTNGSINCNNWRANQAGYYRCKLTYDNDKEQVSGNIQVTEANNNKTNKQHIGITYNLPIISVNTGATDFPSDADLATESSNCGNSRYPSIHADDLKKKRSVDVMMFNPDGTICYDRKARMNYRGSSSLNFQKKSYAFCPGKEKCGDDEKGADYVKTNKENLFGLSDGAADKDWVLYAATPDPSMMRNRLVFDLYKKMRPDEWGVNSMYVELVVNGEYRGVYVLMDKITNNANRVNIKNENGFIVKFDKTDVVDRVENAGGDQKTFATSRTGTKNSSNGNESYGTCIDQRFEIEYPEKEDIDLWDAFYGNVQQRFEDFETALANKDYATVRTLIDYDSWADWFILTELAKNQDGFRASCIFVYDGDKIEARPLWDQELSFNNGTRVKHGIADPEGLLITTSSVYDDAFYPPFWFTGNKGTTVTGGLLNDPCFVSLVKQKWATYQSGVCSAASIGTMVAAYNTELGDAINREAARWPYTEAARGTTTDGDYIGYYSQGEGNPSQYSYAASKAAITAWASDRSTALTAGSGLGKAINGLNGEALIFTISPSSVETTPWKQVLLTVNAPEGYEYTFDDSSINNATVRASVKKDNNTYAIKIPRPTAWGIGGNGDPGTQTQYQVSATIEVSGENECGTIQNGTATSTITLTDVTEDCNPEIVKP